MSLYKSTFSSGAKKVSVGNDLVDFKSKVYPFDNINVQFLHFQTFDLPCSIKLNSESTIHWIDANSEFIISDIAIEKFTIIDSGVTYYYTAMTSE